MNNNKGPQEIILNEHEPRAKDFAEWINVNTDLRAIVVPDSITRDTQVNGLCVSAHWHEADILEGLRRRFEPPYRGQA